MSDITVVTQEIAAALAESNTELIGKIVKLSAMNVHRSFAAP